MNSPHFCNVIAQQFAQRGKFPFGLTDQLSGFSVTVRAAEFRSISLSISYSDCRSNVAAGGHQFVGKIRDHAHVAFQ
ncbi:MAG: hypothetical protein MZV63_55065 [Marinilabiliales bacterium]|nr:hypothetical protein [Marinilabiliales bacterium]